MTCQKFDILALFGVFFEKNQVFHVKHRTKIGSFFFLTKNIFYFSIFKIFNIF